MSAKRTGIEKTLKNQIPPLVSDCILPIIDLPLCTQDFEPDATQRLKKSQDIFTDSFLNVPIRICDFGFYAEKAGDQDIAVEDYTFLKSYASETQNDEFIYNQETTRIDSSTPTQHQQTQQKQIQFLKSGFVSSEEDESVQKQLEAAFNGNVPPGKVKLIRRSEPISIIKFAGYEPREEETKCLLFSKSHKAFKVVPQEGGEVISGFSYSTDPKDNRIYMSIDKDGDYIFGEIEKIYKLKKMTPKDFSENPHTKTATNFD